jgi:hypothetical protein
MRTLITMMLGLLLFASGSARTQVVLPLPAEDQQNITAQLGAATHKPVAKMSGDIAAAIRGEAEQKSEGIKS